MPRNAFSHRIRFSHRAGLIPVLTALLLAAPPLCAQTFEGLGFLDAGASASTSEALDVSGDGSVVVGWSLLDTGNGRGPQTTAFRWRDSLLTRLPHAYVQYQFGNLARGVSTDGDVAVGWSTGAVVGQMRATTRWVGLDATDVGPQVTSEGYAVSDDGRVVVGSYASRTLRWAQGSGAELITIGSQSLARDVSANGAVMVGYAFDPGTRAYRWENGTVQYLPGFASEGQDAVAEAYGISGDASIVVGTARRAGQSQMVRWVNGVLEDLGGGGVALSTSANGAIIVGHDNGVGTARRARIWTPGGGVEDLSTFLVQRFALDLTGWTLTTAAAVSADGSTIVGSGRNPNGNTEAWRVTFRTTNELIVNVDGDGADANAADNRCDVDTTEPGLQCTLRAALQEVVAGRGVRIVFAIPGASVPRIALQSALPAITRPVEIDGTTQSGGRVEVRGGAGFDGLRLSGGSSVVRGLVLNGFTRVGETGGSAIVLSGSGGNTIAGNYVGTDVAGNGAIANRAGVVIDGSPDNIVGGTGLDANVISGNEFGVVITGQGANDNRVLGNRIGLAANGGFRRNRFGLLVVAGNGNVIGGATPNRIASIAYDVAVQSSADALSGTEISGNFIGLDAAGTGAGSPAAESTGVVVAAFDTGTVSATRVIDNQVAGPTLGIWVLGAAVTDTRVAGNRVGLAFDDSGSLPSGLTANPLSTGIRTDDAPGVMITANLVAGQRYGILTAGSLQAEEQTANGETTFTLYGPQLPLSNDPGAGNDVSIVGNTVGLNGRNAVPAGAVQDSGIVAFGGARGTRIADNTIAGYSQHDVWLSESANLAVTGNRIGTADGANHGSATGVYVESVDTAIIGGEDAVARNLIARHSVAGVTVDGESSSIAIRNNFIGTDAAGESAWSSAAGIRVLAPEAGIPGLVVRGNVIGGITGVAVDVANALLTDIVGNRIGLSPNGIAVRNGAGVQLAATPATLTDNFIANNDGPAIRIDGEAPVTMSGNAVYANDAGIVYASAPFAPPAGVLVMRTDPADTGRVGVFVAVPATGAPGTVTIEIFGNRDCANAQGRVPLLRRDVAGDAPFIQFVETTSLSAFGTLDGFTATATRGAATSAFSACGAVLPFADSDDDGALDLFELLGGDRNGDGSDDASQRNVATHLTNPEGGNAQFVTIVSAPGTTVQQSRVITANLPPIEGATYTVGLFAFDIQGVASGTQTSVDILLSTGRPAESVRYIKVPRIESADFRYLPETGTGDRAERTGTGWRLYLTDGGEWDVDGAANGRIRDPGGPVVANAAPPPPPPTVPPVVVTDSRRGGSGALDPLAGLVLLLTLALLRRQRPDAGSTLRPARTAQPLR